MKIEIETNADYWQIKEALDQVLDLSTYQNRTYGRSADIIAHVLRQIQEAQLKASMTDGTDKKNTEENSL